MRNLFLNIGGAQPHWMQHNLPWLAALAAMLGLLRDEATFPDEQGGFDG